jgi:RNA polymerase sigma-70 factor (ECF subfamily)
MTKSISAIKEADAPPTVVARTPEFTGNGTEHRREFDHILSHSLPRFRRIALRVLRNPEDAEDAVQDAMLSAHRHIGHFAGRSQMTTWITSILINAVRMQLRRRSRRPTLSLDQDPEEGMRSAEEWLVDPSPTPEQTLQGRELSALLIKHIAGLSPSQRGALHLRQQRGLSIKQAAEALGVPEGTVKARLARARAELAHRFREVTGAAKTRTASRASLARRKPHSGYAKDEATRMPQLPAAVFDSQSACENWMSA